MTLSDLPAPPNQDPPIPPANMKRSRSENQMASSSTEHPYMNSSSAEHVMLDTSMGMDAHKGSNLPSPASSRRSHIVGGLGPIVCRNMQQFSQRTLCSPEDKYASYHDVVSDLDDSDSVSDTESSSSIHSDSDDDTSFSPTTVTTKVRHALIGRHTTLALCRACENWFSDAGAAPQLRLLRQVWDHWQESRSWQNDFQNEVDIVEELEASRLENAALRSELVRLRGGASGALHKRSTVAALSSPQPSKRSADETEKLAQLTAHELIALLDEKDAEIENLKTICAELEQACFPVCHTPAFKYRSHGSAIIRVHSSCILSCDSVVIHVHSCA
jgi:hypothetical protein